MYIHPFLAGVLFTVLFEFGALTLFTIFGDKKK